MCNILFVIQILVTFHVLADMFVADLKTDTISETYNQYL